MDFYGSMSHNGSLSTLWVPVPPFPLGTQAIPLSWTFRQYSPAKTHPKNQPIVWEQLSFRFNLWDLALNLTPEIIGKTLG